MEGEEEEISSNVTESEEDYKWNCDGEEARNLIYWGSNWKWRQSKWQHGIFLIPYLVITI